jgi:hypothetical protein
MPVNRRDFLLLRPDGAKRPSVLSCERLYMRYVDARADGAADRLFDALAADLGEVQTVRLTDTSWLSCDELKVRLDRVLERFRAAGGRVLKGTSC